MVVSRAHGRYIGVAIDSFTSAGTETVLEASCTRIESFFISKQSYGTTLTVILALALNQTAQKRAQEELDSVVGVERMPTITDAPNLPYLVSCIKEAMRWRPPVPLCAYPLILSWIHRLMSDCIALPRRTAQDDVYNGYFIPKDTMVLPNVW